MKNLLFLLWIFPAVCVAQKDSASVQTHVIYCKLFLESINFKTRVRADFGKKTSTIYNTNIDFEKLNGNLATFNNEVDGLNYMALQGWELVTFALDREERIYLLKKSI